MTPDDLNERVARAICYNRAAPACDCRAKGSTTCRALVENLMWESNEISSQARAAVRLAMEEAAKLAEIYEYDELEDDGGTTIKPSAAIRAMIKGNDVQQA